MKSELSQLLDETSKAGLQLAIQAIFLIAVAVAIAYACSGE